MNALEILSLLAALSYLIVVVLVLMQSRSGMKPAMAVLFLLSVSCIGVAGYTDFLKPASPATCARGTGPSVLAPAAREALIN